MLCVGGLGGVRGFEVKLRGPRDTQSFLVHWAGSSMCGLKDVELL